MVQNIRLLNPNVTRSNGYFYSFDHQTDTMVQKADDGTLAFAYPLDTPIPNTIRSLEFDGESYWTQEWIDDGDADAGFRIRRWLIDNFVMVLQQTFTFDTDANDIFESSAFTTETYEGTVVAFGGAVSPSVDANKLTVTFDGGNEDIADLLTPGTNIFVGPSTQAGFEGETKRFTVNTNSVAGGNASLTLTTNKTVGFATSDPVVFTKNLWFFNQHFLTQTNIGALYKVNALDGSILQRQSGGAFLNVNGAGFHNVQSFPAATALEAFNGHYLLFIRTTNLLFVDVLSSNLDTVLSAVQNNINAATTTVFDVFDLALAGNTIFRLQTDFNINGSESSESTYNYQLATFRPFPTAIALSAVEAVIAAGAGASSSIITATVTDQYALPFVTTPASTITFATTGGGTGSGVSPTTQSLDSSGQATTTYTSGDTAGLVVISAEVTIA